MNTPHLLRDRAEPAHLDPDFAEVTCPHCSGQSCSVLSLFGSAASEVLFRCDDCKTCFNWIKWQHRLPGSPDESPLLSQQSANQETTMPTRVLPNPERRRTGVDFIVRRAAELYPQRIAIDDRLHKRQFTYGELYHRSTQLARALARLGIQKGDLVAYAFYNEHTSLEILFACTILGAVALPLNNRLQPEEAQNYLHRHGCRVFVGNRLLQHLVDPNQLDVLVLHGDNGEPQIASALDYETLVAAEPTTPLPPAATWEDPYMMAMTGGTTGGSKAAVWGHGGSMLDMLGIALHMGIGRRCRTICLAPTYHAAGLGWGVLPVLWQGGTLVMPPSPSFSPQFLANELRTSHIDYLLLVPALVELLYDSWDKKPFDAGVVCVTSAPSPPAQREKIAQMFPDADLQAGYGMTETFSIAMQDPGELTSQARSVGEVCSVSRVRIVDTLGKSQPPGSTGQIAVRTLAMAMGYQNDEANSKFTFVTLQDDPEDLEWCMTGDIGSLDEDGRLTVVDRVKDIIITGGENVASVEVESIACEHAGLHECAVVGKPDQKWGEKVVLVVAAADPQADKEALARELIALCRSRLAAYKVPKEVAFVDALPRSAFGKVLKRNVASMDFLLTFDTNHWKG